MLKKKIVLHLISKHGSITAKKLTSILKIEKKDLNSQLYKLQTHGLTKKDEASQEWSLTVKGQFKLITTHAMADSNSPPSKKLLPPVSHQTSRDGSKKIKDAIERLREELLDLTRRNSLINASYNRGKKFIHIVDELPAQVCSSLLDQDELSFESIPDPTDKEIKQWLKRKEKNEGTPTPIEVASWHNIDLNSNLARESRKGIGRRHSDKALQTPYYAKELEARLKSIQREADLQIQETGMNTLCLTIGYLEWFESKNSDKACLSPLFSIPVTLVKGKLNQKTQTYSYTLAWSGEDLITNLSLAKRLERDFDFILPPLLPDTDGNLQEVEAYLTQVAKTTQKAFPRWSVLRRGTLAFLNFAKLLMYNDLDTDKWPELLTHKLVRAAILGSERNGPSETNSFSSEHHIDDIPDLHTNFPLVDSADSSQYSAIIDALNGENLVIEGPPGTGKSQTIANLIAALLNQGKTVLFVSEKMAALSVVKDKLSNLKLGDFLLELHSHATKKMGVIDSFKTRLNHRLETSPRTLQKEISKNQNLTTTLNKHARLVNTRWNDTELTISEIFTAYTRENESLDSKLKVTAENLIIKNIETPYDREELYRRAENFRKSSLQIAENCKNANIALHPWFGVTSGKLTHVDKPHVITLLKAWKTSLLAVNELIQDQCSFIKQPIELAYSDIPYIQDFLDRFPDHRGIFWNMLCWGLDCNENKQVFEKLIFEISTIKRQNNELAYHLPLDQVISIPKFEHSDLTQDADALEISNHLTIDELSSINNYLDTVDKHSNIIHQILEEYDDFCEGLIPKELKPNEATIVSVQRFVAVCNWVMKNNTAQTKRSEEFLSKDALEHIHKVKEKLAAYLKVKKRFDVDYDTDSLPSISDLTTCTTHLKEAVVLTRLLNSNYKKSIGILRSCFRGSKKAFKKIDLNTHIQNLSLIHSTKSAYSEVLKEHPINLNAIFEDSNFSPSDLDRSASWHKDLMEHFGENEGKLLSVFKLGELERWLIHSPIDKLMAVERILSAGLPESIDKLTKSLNYLDTISEQELPHIETSVKIVKLTEHPWYRNLRGFSRKLHIARDYSLVYGEQILRTSITQISKVDDLKAKISLFYNHFRIINETLEQQIDVSKFPLSEIFQRVSRTYRVLSDNIFTNDALLASRQLFINAIQNNSTIEGFKKYESWALSILETYALAETSYLELNKILILDLQYWLGAQKTLLPTMIDRCQLAVDHDQQFVEYALFLQGKSNLSAVAPPLIIKAILSKCETEDSLRSLCRMGIMRAYTNDIFHTHGNIRCFQGISHDSYISEFKISHQKLQKLRRRQIAIEIGSRYVPSGDRGYRVSEHTGAYLISRECEKQKGHIPIRQLLSRAAGAAQGLKPCFMMGPRSVAQYLTPSKLKFDVLVIDEASQLKPAEALGACARASQIVVVGDSKQLPPTSFFDRNVDEDEDDQIALSDNESILDAARGANFQSRILRWHYRSRHESLIAFSNKNFYSNELELFPSPQRTSSDYGIEYFYMEDGLFENQQNRVEAWAIAKRVEHLILNTPQISLGVATMNRRQSDLIEGYVEQIAKENCLFDSALNENRESSEVLFIKNLETVQGDERDVIIISCTYGRGKLGNTPQRFGPINGEMGWRRLNVLFTRSRTRMEIFSSMHHGDIKLTENSSRGIHALREFLHYAETGHLSSAEKSERPADSDFEIAVADMLKTHGYNCDFQVGVTGFFIDIAVQHPANPNRHIMGIECDGATYHSAKSARDRDCLRQEILESLGWKIRRIWSTDWFNDPQRCITPILRELEILGKNPIVESKKQIWLHDVEKLSEDPLKSNSSELISNQKKSASAIEPKDNSITVSIKVHDTVRIQYEDSKETQTFEIIYGPSSIEKNKLNHESPLARLLLNKPIHLANEYLQFSDRKILVLACE